jgi:hypothetical protein
VKLWHGTVTPPDVLLAEGLREPWEGRGVFLTGDRSYAESVAIFVALRAGATVAWVAEVDGASLAEVYAVDRAGREYVTPAAEVVRVHEVVIPADEIDDLRAEVAWLADVLGDVAGFGGMERHRVTRRGPRVRWDGATWIPAADLTPTT